MAWSNMLCYLWRVYLHMKVEMCLLIQYCWMVIWCVLFSPHLVVLPGSNCKQHSHMLHNTVILACVEAFHTHRRVL